MVIQKELKKLFHRLSKDDFAEVEMGGSNVLVRVFDQKSTLSLSTPVYFGGNFIPKSVRHCISMKAPFIHNGIKTTLSVDEENFKIYLNYLGLTDNLNGDRFNDLLEEFAWLADEWRFYLDENDKNDLIHIHAR
jgi:hypothetical protein